MPEEGIVQCDHHEVLRYEEIVALVEVAVTVGISRLRLTGGEPLARSGLIDLVAMLRAVEGIAEISMTSNGTLLTPHAQSLAEAGLDRVNVSLDTLKPARYQEITRWGKLDDVLAGIAAAQKADLTPVKINMVVIRGLNDDEVIDFARRTVEPGWHVRFIELIPLGQGALWSVDSFMPTSEIRARIESSLGPLEEAELTGSGPAQYWRLPGASGSIGFISPVSEHFCARCNRLRLTADGRLLPCLFARQASDMRRPLRGGASEAALRKRFQEAIEAKPATCPWEGEMLPGRLMSQIGG
jgi:cyclic pyranopterin phosphate synthase